MERYLYILLFIYSCSSNKAVENKSNTITELIECISQKKLQEDELIFINKSNDNYKIGIISFEIYLKENELENPISLNNNYRTIIKYKSNFYIVTFSSLSNDFIELTNNDSLKVNTNLSIIEYFLNNGLDKNGKRKELYEFKVPANCPNFP